MKDATHHLKHVQRKVIQEARREERLNKGPIESGIQDFKKEISLGKKGVERRL